MIQIHTSYTNILDNKEINSTTQVILKLTNIMTN